MPRSTPAPLQNVEGLTRARGLISPRRVRRGPLALLGALLAAALIGALLLVAHRDPTSLDEVMLAGPRPPGCVNLVVADDFSGSMTSFTQQRTAAEQALVHWSGTNLRPDDRLTILAWAGTAETVLSPTRIDQLASTGVPSADLSAIGDGTALLPMLDLVTTLPDTGCRIALMVISDSEITDGPGNPDQVRNSLGAAGVQSVSLLNPIGDVQTPEWQSTLPFTRVVAVNQSDPQELAFAFGGEVAAATGQSLQVRG